MIICYPIGQGITFRGLSRDQGVSSGFLKNYRTHAGILKKLPYACIVVSTMFRQVPGLSGALRNHHTLLFVSCQKFLKMENIFNKKKNIYSKMLIMIYIKLWKFDYHGS
jgi:hypothetical protein